VLLAVVLATTRKLSCEDSIGALSATMGRSVENAGDMVSQELAASRRARSR
jgi:hypothetical protein